MKKIFAFSMIFVLLTLCACNPPESTSTTIKLPFDENASSEWTYIMEPEGIVVETEHVFVPKGEENTLLGGGSKMAFTFESVKAGDVVIKWTRAEPAATALTQITVEDNKNLIHHGTTISE